jgi:DNA (cytosine-5)-methyltransferase 1
MGKCADGGVMYELALFAGAGGGLLGSKWLLGWRTVCYVENGEYPVQVLRARIRDGFLDDAPIWGDVRTFDGRPWRGVVDCVSAGFPCQPWAQGGKERGEDDPRNLWPDTVRIVGEVRPTWVLLENSPNLLQRSHKRKLPPYVRRIIGELAGLGYVGRWGCLSAAALGFDHKRRRLWIVAYAGGEGRAKFLRVHEGDGAAGDAQKAFAPVALESVWSRLSRLEERLGEPSVFGADDGMANRVERLEAVGEGQVPAVVAAVWGLLGGGGVRWRG